MTLNEFAKLTLLKLKNIKLQIFYYSKRPANLSQKHFQGGNPYSDQYARKVNSIIH